MEKSQRKQRIIARGEHSNHCHVVTGNAEIERTNDGIFINVNPEDGLAYMKHLLEDKWMSGQEVWTSEHTDILIDGKGSVRHGDVLLKQVSKNRYQYIAQIEYDPFEDIIRQVVD